MARVGWVLVGLGVLASGCGGGGGGGVVVHPATTYRGNAIGDSWTYAITLNLGTEGTGKGTLVNALASDTYNGQATVKETQTINVDLKSGPTVSVGISESSLTGALLATTSDGTVYAVTSDTFNTGNTIGAGFSTSGVITLSDGETLTENYKVLGAEMCTTPAGTFATWLVSQTVVDSDGFTDNFRIWVAPETGSYVKITDTTTTPIGTAYTYVAELTSQVTVAGGTGLARSPRLFFYRPKV